MIDWCRRENFPFRFSLRFMFLALTASAIGAYFEGRLIRDFQENNEIDERISRLGGRVTRAPVARGCFVYFRPKLASRIVRVDLVNRHVDQDELKLLARLKELQSLYLYYTDVDDEGIAHLSACRQLQTLDLDGTRIGDAGLSAIARLPRLRWLSLRQTRIHDDGLKCLYSQKNLEAVMLWETQVTEEGLEALRTALPRVFASRTPQDDSVPAE